MADFRVVQGCPCNATLAPYVALLAKETKGTVNSVYRGADASSILRAHGHMSQTELYDGFMAHRPGFLPANPPGRSTHELRSDGVAYAGPVGRVLEWWQQGFDVNDDEVSHWRAAAASHGWTLFQPYSSGSEFHHLNFKHRPVPRGATRARLIVIRATLPRK